MSDFSKQCPFTIPTVRKRVPVHPEIGSLFRELRTEAGWGLRQAARIAEEKGLRLLTMNSLGFLERGVTKNPDPELLREVAALYKVSYAPLAAKFAAMRYGIEINGTDLIRPPMDQASDLSKGESADVTAAATRLQQQHAALLAATEQVALSLFDALSALEKQGVPVPVSTDHAGTAARQSSTRARRRKAG